MTTTFDSLTALQQMRVGTNRGYLNEGWLPCCIGEFHVHANRRSPIKEFVNKKLQYLGSPPDTRTTVSFSYGWPPKSSAGDSRLLILASYTPVGFPNRCRWTQHRHSEELDERFFDSPANVGPPVQVHFCCYSVVKSDPRKLGNPHRSRWNATLQDYPPCQTCVSAPLR